jgi:hypothetical protein
MSARRDPFENLELMKCFPMSFVWLVETAKSILDAWPKGYAVNYVADAFGIGAKLLLKDGSENHNIDNAKKVALELAAKANSKHDIYVLYFFTKAGVIRFGDYAAHVNLSNLAEGARKLYNQYAAEYYINYRIGEENVAQLEWAVQHLALTQENFEALGEVLNTIGDLGGNVQAAEAKFIEYVDQLRQVLSEEERWYLAVNYIGREENVFISQQLLRFFAVDGDYHSEFLEICEADGWDDVSNWATDELAKLKRAS